MRRYPATDSFDIGDRIQHTVSNRVGKVVKKGYRLLTVEVEMSGGKTTKWPVGLVGKVQDGD